MPTIWSVSSRLNVHNVRMSSVHNVSNDAIGKFSGRAATGSSLRRTALLLLHYRRMTQHDPDPANLPEAIPVLSYERQTDDGAMDWVVRFIGAWVICNGATSILYYCVLQTLQSGLRGFYLPSIPWALAMLSGAASIVFGIAIVRRQRYGFYGRLVVLALYPVTTLVPSLFSASGLILLNNLLTTAISAGGAFAALLSILRRADAKGVLQPIRVERLDALQDGRSIEFLISRTGWMFLAQGGIVVVHLAMWPLLIWGKVPVGQWNWQSSVQVALMLALAVGGLLMCQRRAWAIWLVATILPLATIGGPLLAMWQYYFPQRTAFSPQLTQLIPSAVNTAASVFMLCLLARKAARTGM